MLPHDLFGMLRIAADDGVEDPAVIVDQVGFHGVEDLEKLPSPAMGVHQDARHGLMQHDQRLGLAGGHHRAMKLEIRHPAGIRIVDRLDDARERLLQLLEIGHGRPFRREPDSLALDGDARLHHIVDDVGLLGEREGEKVVEHGQVRPADDCSDPVADLDHPQHSEGAKSLPQDRSADTELRSKIALRDEPVARTQ